LKKESRQELNESIFSNIIEEGNPGISWRNWTFTNYFTIGSFSIAYKRKISKSLYWWVAKTWQNLLNLL